MRKNADKTIIMESESIAGMRIFGVIVKSLAYCMFYIALFSALPVNAARFCAVIPGIAVAASYLVFRDNRTVRLIVVGVVALYTVLCVSIGFDSLYSGIIRFCNDVAYTANTNLHWGFASVGNSPAGGDFLFSSVAAVWIALGSAALCRRKSLVFVTVSCIVLVLWLCLGLFPEGYAAGLYVFSVIGVLLCDRGYTLKASVSYIVCTVIVFCILIPCFFYTGGGGIPALRRAITNGAENIAFGSDSLPEGRLEDADKMLLSDDERLRVTLSARISELYLKGFVGAELEGNAWKSTDKNAYVAGNYQGLLNYISGDGIPFTQYKRYSQLGGLTDEYDVSIENVGADRKYVYLPYTVCDYSAGAPYYDLNIRNNPFAKREYSFTIFGSGGSCEKVSPAAWALQTASTDPVINAYFGREDAYRAFVYDTYTDIDENIASAISGTTAGTKADSVYVAARLIRDWFTRSFEYSATPDKIESDFLSDFFGGKIKKANAAYFASAATYIFRKQGFAARYVEGYLLRTDVESGLNEIVLTGRNSHAWTEVYFDRIGWLPIEVTPTVAVEEPETPDPDSPDVPTAPSAPPEVPPEPEEPPETEDPDIDTSRPSDPKQSALLTALKVLVPILSVLLVAALTVLAAVIRRDVVIKRKRKKLCGNGEAYGRALYGIIEKDCARLGGFSESTLAAVGISEERTRRFVGIVERCVYGGYELNLNEKTCAENFLKDAGEALIRGGGKLRALICEYLLCVGI